MGRIFYFCCDPKQHFGYVPLLLYLINCLPNTVFNIKLRMMKLQFGVPLCQCGGGYSKEENFLRVLCGTHQ